MTELPDLEGLAIFAKVAECRSFADAAAQLRLSQATVSKAISRIELRLGARLITRNARRFGLTDAGQQLVDLAAHILARGEEAEDVARAQSRALRGLVRLAVPMSFGILRVAPLLPKFLSDFPEVTIDLHLSDARTDVIAESFHAAIRIGVEPGASLVAQRWFDIPRYLVGSPTYLDKYGRPKHPRDLAKHRCISYSLRLTTEVWRFTKNGKTASVWPSGPLRVNNGDAILPALIAGTGLGIQPDFFVRDALQSGLLERLLPDWSIPLGAVYWITPEGPTPKRVEVLGQFLNKSLAR